MTFKIDFEPIGLRAICESGETLLGAAQRAGVMLAAVCGGEGSCGRCKVKVLSGQVSSPEPGKGMELSRADYSSGWRLACQSKIIDDLRIHVPPESLVTTQRIQTEGQTLDVVLDPAVNCIQLEMDYPTLIDNCSDSERVRVALGNPRLIFNVPVLRSLPINLRANDFKTSIIVRGDEVVSVAPAHAPALGLAVDIGTTKIAAYLIDLKTGTNLAAKGMMNPQIAFGEDVMARISHAMTHPNGSEQLRFSVVNAINELADQLCLLTNHTVKDIVDAVIVGNTAMHHLFLGLPVKQLGLAPYISAESAALDLSCNELGLDLAPGAGVHILPNIAGFVGADHVAMLLASDLPKRGSVVLALDIGTNTEVSLFANGLHLSCSTASGPAFEGAHIRHGMRAAEGAIEKVVIKNGKVMIKTVGDQPAVGLCGSGILDLVAQLRRSEILSPRGGFLTPHGDLKNRISPQGDEFMIVLDSENNGKAIGFNRSDVNEIQLAKAAIRAGINILLDHANVTETSIEEVVVAGAFGTYLDVISCIEIGMFPHIDPCLFKQVGNASGVGARMALLSMAQREKAKLIADGVEYIELTTEKKFAAAFSKALFL